MDASEWAELEEFLETDEKDYAALVAALASVDESTLPSLPQPSEEQLPTPPTPSSTDTATTSEDGGETAHESPVKTRKRRHTRRDQIQLLHTTARQLEARLALLKERSTNGGVASVARVTNSTDKTNQLWKQIATNQVKALSESERENARLRSMVEDQLRVIKSLERLVTKKRSKTFLWYPEFSKSSSGVDPIEDPEFEKEMSTSMDEMLSDVDRILADERLQGDWDEPVSYVDVSSDDQDHPLIESLHTKLFPATYQAAANMLWKMWTSSHVHAINNLRRKDIQVDGDSMRGIMEGEFKARNVTTHFRTKMVGRRVIQDDRIIMPAVVLIEPMIKIDDKPLSGIYLRLRICNIFRNVAGTDESVTTRVFYALCTPMVFGEDEEYESRGFGALTKLVLQTSRVRLNMNNQILENQLLKGFAKVNLSDKQ